MKRQLFETEHNDFRAVVRAFAERELMGAREQHAEQGFIPRDIWSRAGGLGLLGLCVPEEHGGAGIADYRYNAIMDEELTGAGLAYACALGVHTHVIAPYFVDLGTEEQRARWLPGMSSGELISAIAMTEPSAGSDLRAMRTRAVWDGTDWILSGSKTYITNGSTADVVVVAAQAERDGASLGITLFVIEAGAAGFKVGQRLHKLGQMEGDTAELFFGDVRVPDAQRLGQAGAGFGYLMDHLAQERLASAVCNVAHARTVLEDTVTFVAERQAFGRAINDNQFVRFALADMTTEIEAAQALVDRCIALHLTKDLTAVDAAMAKLKSSEVQSSVVDTCLQLHGGLGYMREARIARDWLDARVTRIWAGTSEIMREVIGRSVTK